MQERAKEFLDDYELLCKKHGLIMLNSSKTSEGITISTIADGKVMALDDILDIKDIMNSLRKDFS